MCVCEVLGSCLTAAAFAFPFPEMMFRRFFFGVDMLSNQQDRALISTYQKLGLYAQNNLTVLGPKKAAWNYKVTKEHSQEVGEVNKEQLFDAVTFYQAANHLFNSGKLKEIARK